MTGRGAAAALVAFALTACGGGDRAPAPEPLVSNAAAVLKDGLVAAAVKAKLTADEPDSIVSLGVAARDGVVTLSGAVLSAAVRERAVAGAKSVTGVASVVDRLRVDPNGARPKERVADFALAARISAALAAQVGFTRVRVRVERGVATLEGSVPDAGVKATALATARGTHGIRNVVDRLRVERS